MTGEKPLLAAALLSGSGSDSLIIDATKLAFASPLDLAGIIATAHWADRGAIRVTLCMPHDVAVAAYLRRMNVLALLPRRALIRGGHRNVTSDFRGVLMEVTRLDEHNVDGLTELLGPRVRAFYADSSAETGAAVFRACSELMANATEHGASPDGAYVAAQAYSGLSTGVRRLEFAICDAGRGVMDHLRQNPKYEYLARDELAIAKAMQAGVSGVSDERGNGLVDAIDDLRRHGQTLLQIRSGRGEVRAEGGPATYLKRAQSRPDQTSGTWAWLAHRLLT